MFRSASFERFPPERIKNPRVAANAQAQPLRGRFVRNVFASFRLFFTSYRWTVIKFHFPDRSLKNSSICGAVVS